MSRRHHHHNLQPYDYERFSDHSRDREQTRGIEYQDDSLSSINSEEESYLHHHPRSSKDKKATFTPKSESSKAASKNEKTAEPETFHQNDAKNQSNSDSASTTERLGRLEAMLAELIKRNNSQGQPPQNKPEKSTPPVVEKSENKMCLVPRRHDFTTSMWINKIQEVSIQNNWSEKSTIQYMEAQMSGLVKAWYNSLPNYDFTWPEWKILITKIFPDNTDFVTTLKRLVTRLKQADETISTYYFSKMYLTEACKITGEDAVSCLIDGLNNQMIQEQAKAHNFLTPETLYSQFLMTLPDYTVDYLPTAPPSAESVINNWYYEPQPAIEDGADIAMPQEELIEYEREELEQEDFEYHNRGSDEIPPPKRTGTVHSRLDKRFIRTNQFRHHNKIPMAARVCTICDKRGHLARNCRNVDKIMCYTQLKNPPKNIFHKDAIINSHHLPALIDTGATTVSIKESEARILNLELAPSSSHILSYGGAFVEVLGTSKIDVEVDKVKVPVRAVIVEDHVQDVPVIIGQDFLTQKNVSMFLNNETLKIFRDPQPYL